MKRDAHDGTPNGMNEAGAAVKETGAGVNEAGAAVKETGAAANGTYVAVDEPGAAGAGAVLDWTRGTPGLALQRCGRCSHLWYFRRDFCPSCGAGSPAAVAADGAGVVYSTTLVHRAPSDAFRALAPYRLVLVTLDEGVRVMGHGDPALRIGDRVRAGFRDVAGRPVPYFELQQETSAS